MQKYYSMNVNTFWRISEKKIHLPRNRQMYFEESLRGGKDVKNLEIF